MSAKVEALLTRLDDISSRAGHEWNAAKDAAALIRAQAEEIARLQSEKEEVVIAYQAALNECKIANAHTLRLRDELGSVQMLNDGLRANIDAIADVFGIGSAARSAGIILANVRNANRRSDCLSAIEREFFTRTGADEDGEQAEECLLNWGADPEEYVEQYRKVQIETATAGQELLYVAAKVGVLNDGTKGITWLDNRYLREGDKLYAAPVPAGDAVSVPRNPTDAEWGMIQKRVDDDCPMSIVADLGTNPPRVSWNDAAGRIISYAESAFAQGMIAAMAK
jgi:hypothetical protein